MDKLFNYSIISNEELSVSLLNIGITNFSDALNYIKLLPYGRNSNRSDYTLILKEQKGTCSTKHAFLATIAEQNNFMDVKLFFGIFKMCEENVQDIGFVLNKWNLPYLPEAHCYLKIDTSIIDVTRITNSLKSFENTLLLEEIITPKQIGDYKVNKHQTYLKQWIIDKSIPYNFETIWQIREDCIKNLTQ